MRRFVTTLMLAGALAGCGVSTQQEVAMGADYARQINAQLPLVTDPEVNRYIRVLGDSIAGLADDRSLEWQFYIVDSPEVNAFAVPGGFIYMNRGLIERADNLAQVAGVLGHEIGHVTMRHSIDQMQKGQTANVGMVLLCVLTPSVCASDAGAAAIQIGAGAVFARFSRQDEHEADQVGVTYVTRAGISPIGIPQMFRKLLEERERRPAAVEAWFSTHPLAEDRIAETQAMIDAIDPIILQSLTVDSPNFQAFKRRLQSLPPSPAPPRR
jgi:beta-barrel assembly-enhancing protease